MVGAPEATLIVTLRHTDDFEAARREISKISGVSSVEFYSFSNKLRVRYDGDAKRNIEIQAAIKKVIARYK